MYISIHLVFFFSFTWNHSLVNLKKSKETKELATILWTTSPKSMLFWNICIHMIFVHTLNIGYSSQAQLEDNLIEYFYYVCISTTGVKNHTSPILGVMSELKTFHRFGTAEMAQSLKVLIALPEDRGPGWHSQNPISSSQLTVTPVAGEWKPSQQTCM